MDRKKRFEIEEKIKIKQENIIHSNDEFIRFLNYYKNHYKYSIEEVLCMYVQNDTATAYAKFELWNKLSRRVHKGEKGTYIFNFMTNETRYDVVFDLSQTYGKQLSKDIRWSYDEKYNANLIEYLSNKYNVDNNLNLFSMMEKVIYKNISNSEVEVEDINKFNKLIADYIIYTVNERCNISNIDITENKDIFEKYFAQVLSNINNGTKLLFNEIGLVIKEQNKLQNQSKKEKGLSNKNTKDRSFFITEIEENKYIENETVVLEDKIYTVEEVKNNEVYLSNVNNEEVRKEHLNTIVENIIDTEQLEFGNAVDDEYLEYYSNVEKEVTENNNLINYKKVNIEDFSLTKKEKLNDNINAIKLLKTLEKENRLADEKEQIILSKYHGFGGLPEVFDNRKNSYLSEKAELLEILAESEYKSCKSSTLNAHYTSDLLINTMYKALEKMGFENGNILEPSMGVGNFFSLLPKEFEKSKLYGVELDDITGRLSKQLYQNANIKITGFEKTNFKDDFFDIVIGNVPFGDYKVFDKDYAKYNLLIHDYFIAKSLDKAKEGGVVAVITSKGTMDKQNEKARRLIAEKADLICAIRLPNNAFKDTANTEVVSDILFFQKNSKVKEINDIEWIKSDKIEVDNQQFNINNYFKQHPNMILGDFKVKSGAFGNELTVIEKENMTLQQQLNEILDALPSNIIHIDNKNEVIVSENEVTDIEVDYNVKNYCYTIKNNNIYRRVNDKMQKLESTGTKKARIKGQVEIREQVRNILNLQLNNCSDEILFEEQQKLNNLYDNYVQKYGYLESKANKIAFRDDADAMLLIALESVTENKDTKEKIITKTDIFYKRTIQPTKIIDKVDTPKEGLIVCLNQKGKIDIEHISKLSSKTEEEVITDLLEQNLIFKNPEYENSDKYIGYETADEYLSGNVKIKLQLAKTMSKLNEKYNKNILALEKVQPKKLDATEIDIQLGSIWIPNKYIEQFIKEKLSVTNDINVNFLEITGRWKLEKPYIRNLEVTNIYGTSRINAFEIIERSLNLQKVKIYDLIEEGGKEKRVLNSKETRIAQSKQKKIENEFKEWIYDDKERRDDLVNIYNDKYNNTVLRKFDGSHLTFDGMTSLIKLRQHQKNAVQRIITNGNTLLAHVVGSGKTFTMVTAGMEVKRLGLAKKPMYVVPNHLIEQWAKDFLFLYPNANILAVTKKDFEKSNRLAFTSRIATGDYDAIIIAHSSFEKIPVSKEYRQELLEEEIKQIEEAIREIEHDKNIGYTVKNLEKTLKSKEEQLTRLNNEHRKDNVLNFEDLGVDYIFVDEAHSFKNLFMYSKMSNIAGVQTTQAQKSTDMFLKTQLINNNINKNNRGVIFATGTPVSNSMVELYTMQKYLMMHRLIETRLHYFDNWVANFGEVTVKMELAPSGQGFRLRERLSDYKNVPELLTMYKEIADIITNDMIDLPLPKLTDDKINIISAKPTDELKRFTSYLARRADAIYSGNVKPNEDNMLTITNEGRKAGLDMRLINPSADDNPTSKVNLCIDNVYEIWERTKENNSTQLLFCDLSTPKINSQNIEDKEFSIYSDIKNKLIKKGIPLEEIAFIHDAKTEKQKGELFEKVKIGYIRILLGSTAKCGAGTNVQDKLVALHDLDCPWKPSDLEQRLGRIMRQGNENEEIEVYRYVTEQSFDAYLWNTVEVKSKFIQQIMNGSTNSRKFKDDNDITLSYGEIKAIATGNPLIKRKSELDMEYTNLLVLENEFTKRKYKLEELIKETYPNKIDKLQKNISYLKHDIDMVAEKREKDSTVTINDVRFTENVDIGTALISSVSKKENIGKVIGQIYGLNIKFTGYSALNQYPIVELLGQSKNKVDLSLDAVGSITRIKNTINKLPDKQEKLINDLFKTKKDFETAKKEVNNTFEFKNKIEVVNKELDEVNQALNENISAGNKNKEDFER